MARDFLEAHGPLRYSTGRRIAGNVCAADMAFEQLEREVSRLGHVSMWEWFAERCRQLELRLHELGGFDEHFAEQLENYGYMGTIEEFERFDETEALMFDLDALAGAFFVTLQPRLNAVKVAAKAVYQAAAEEDGLQVTVPKPLPVPTDFDTAWEVANFVKHNDEWGPTLERRQQPTFAALCRLGVASDNQGQRHLDRWPLIMAACALAGETSLAPAIGAIVTRCQTGGREIMAATQRDFAAHAAAVEAVRQANKPRLRIRSVGSSPTSGN